MRLTDRETLTHHKELEPISDKALETEINRLGNAVRAVSNKLPMARRTGHSSMFERDVSAQENIPVNNQSLKPHEAASLKLS